MRVAIWSREMKAWSESGSSELLCLCEVCDYHQLVQQACDYPIEELNYTALRCIHTSCLLSGYCMGEVIGWALLRISTSYFCVYISFEMFLFVMTILIFFPFFFCFTLQNLEVVGGGLAMTSSWHHFLNTVCICFYTIKSTLLTIQCVS